MNIILHGGEMMEEYGLVLCGGGGRGAYQIGVWRALERLGLRKYITAVSGTSVGALNAALFASVSSKRACDIWCNISPRDIADPAEAIGRALGTVIGFAMSEEKKVTAERAGKLVKSGLFSRDGMISLIEDNGISRSVGSAEFPVFACCHNSTLGRAEYFDMRAFSPKTVTRILTASSAIPGAFPIERIGRYSYRDGGISDNIPVKPLYDIGYRKFIISYLDGVHIDRYRFPDAEFIELFPSEAIYLGENSRSMLSNGTMDFNGANAATRIELGEQETAAFFMLMSSSRRVLLPN